MRELCYIVPASYDNKTVQSFLRRNCGVSARLLVRLKRVEQGITADGLHVRSIDRIHTGQRVIIKLPEDIQRVEAISLPLKIIYEDDDVLVVDKPAGLAVHPSSGYKQPTLASGVIAYYQNSGLNTSFRPINRLDRDTSGLLLTAKNTHAAHLLSGKPKKEYNALVLGRLEGDGVIEQPIRIKQGYGITREVGEGGKYSLTRWKSIAADNEISFLKVIIETGRTHQIRVHMSWLGHPLAGDTMYGSDTVYMKRHALHCTNLSFEHPVSKVPISLTAPIPDDMNSLISLHGWNNLNIK